MSYNIYIKIRNIRLGKSGIGKTVSTIIIQFYHLHF